MISRHDIVIVGAGMVGLSVACLLARDERLRVSIIDAGKRAVFDANDDVSLRVSAVSPGSTEILQRIGAWELIAAQRACPYRDMSVWDAASGPDSPDTLSFSAAEFAVPQLGFIVENVLIQYALLAQLEHTDALQFFETKIATVARKGERFELQLESGELLRPDLLVGADGAKSFVRECAGIDIASWAYPQKAFVTHLQPLLGHRNTALQRFLPEGPVGLLPLEDGRVSTVWSTTQANADAAMAMSDAQLADKMTEVTDGVLGRLNSAGSRGAFPLHAQHAKAYAQAGLVLAGDAAHAVHPLAGQGVNLGFADAAELARVIVEALDRDENPGDLPALRQYERARKGANQTMLHFVDGINRLFSNDSPSLAQLRRTGLLLFNKSGPIRERVVETALGFHA